MEWAQESIALSGLHAAQQRQDELVATRRVGSMRYLAPSPKNATGVDSVKRHGKEERTPCVKQTISCTPRSSNSHRVAKEELHHSGQRTGGTRKTTQWGPSPRSRLLPCSSTSSRGKSEKLVSKRLRVGVAAHVQWQCVQRSGDAKCAGYIYIYIYNHSKCPARRDAEQSTFKCSRWASHGAFH